MGWYEDKRDGVVKKLLTGYGTSMELLELTGGTFDGVTGALTGATEKKHTVTGLIGGYTRARKSDTNVLARNQIVYLSPSGMTVTPAPGHRLKVAGVEYEVVGVQVTAPAGVAVLYQLEIRQP